MSNNRMWLVNKGTGKKVLLAKYYPSTGWRIKFVNDGLILTDAIQDLIADEAPASMFGNCDVSVEYETGTKQPAE